MREIMRRLLPLVLLLRAQAWLTPQQPRRRAAPLQLRRPWGRSDAPDESGSDAWDSDDAWAGDGDDVGEAAGSWDGGGWSDDAGEAASASAGGWNDDGFDGSDAADADANDAAAAAEAADAAAERAMDLFASALTDDDRLVLDDDDGDRRVVGLDGRALDDGASDVVGLDGLPLNDDATATALNALAADAADADDSADDRDADAEAALDLLADDELEQLEEAGVRRAVWIVAFSRYAAACASS